MRGDYTSASRHAAAKGRSTAGASIDIQSTTVAPERSWLGMQRDPLLDIAMTDP